MQKYEEGLEEPMKGSEFSFDSVDSLYYKLHKIFLKRVGSYIDSPKWLKNKKQKQKKLIQKIKMISALNMP